MASRILAVVILLLGVGIYFGRDYFPLANISDVLKSSDSASFQETEKVPTGKLTPLHEAAGKNDLELVRKLLKEGADPHARNGSGETPLFWGGSYEVRKLLIEYGAEVNIKDVMGTTPLHQHADWGTPKTVELLLDEGADMYAEDSSHYYPIFHAENTRTVDLFIERGFDLNKINSIGQTAIFHSDNSRVTAHLIKKGAKVQIRDNEGRTPLHTTYQLKIAEILAKNGVANTCNRPQYQTGQNYFLNWCSRSYTRLPIVNFHPREESKSCRIESDRIWRGFRESLPNFSSKAIFHEICRLPLVGAGRNFFQFLLRTNRFLQRPSWLTE